MRSVARGEKGQAAVELALLLPLIVLILLLIAQIGLVVEHQILVVHAAREGAREAAVNSSAKSIESIVRRRVVLDDNRLRVVIKRSKVVGGDANVQVFYSDPTNVPLVGKLIPDVKLASEVTTRVEP